MQTAARIVRRPILPFKASAIHRGVPKFSWLSNFEQACRRSATSARQVSTLSPRLLRPKATHTNLLRLPLFPRQVRFQSSPANPAKPNASRPVHVPVPEKSLSLSQRLKKLSKEYGWTAVGVYLALSALDFPFCFLAVRWLGTERIGRWEHKIIDSFWSLVGTLGLDLRARKLSTDGLTPQDEPIMATGFRDHGFDEANAANLGPDASTQEILCDFEVRTILTCPQVSGRNSLWPMPFTNPSSLSEYPLQQPYFPRL